MAYRVEVTEQARGLRRTRLVSPHGLLKVSAGADVRILNAQTGEPQQFRRIALPNNKLLYVFEDEGTEQRLLVTQAGDRSDASQGDNAAVQSGDHGAESAGTGSAGPVLDNGGADSANDKATYSTREHQAGLGAGSPVLIGLGLLGGLGAALAGGGSGGSASSGGSGNRDAVAPTITQIVFSGAIGGQNDKLNVGDSVSATVKFSETVIVTGAPTLVLQIGGATVQASYAAGSGTATLSFIYSIQTGETDANGIAIGANALLLNGGTIVDASGNAAVLTHNAVPDNAVYAVDTGVEAPAQTLASDTGSSASDAITSNGLLDVTLAPDVASWRYSSNGGASWSAGTGSSFTLSPGTYAAGSIKVEQTDVAGNVSAQAVNGAVITVDASVATPGLTLHADTGSSASDAITSNGLLDVTLAPDVASWRYSSNGGASWSAGTGSSFTLSPGTYAAGSIKVEQTDVAGNVSAQAVNGAVITVDASVATPGLTLHADTGSSASDAITSNGLLDVTLAPDVASWRYSSNGGASWSAGTGSSFTLSPGTYAAGSIKVEQTDVAGNVSAQAVNGAVITVDASVATPGLTLHADTGSSASDAITSNGLLDVTLAPDVASWRYSSNGGASWSAGTGSSFTLSPGTYEAGSIKVEQTDVAGNVSSRYANASAIVIDQTAPLISIQTANSATKTVTLTYDSVLDSGAIPQGRFSVETGGNDNPVMSIAIHDATVTLTLQNAFSPGLLSVSYTPPETGGLKDIAGNRADGFSSGIIADGYVRGASVYVDTNGNGQADVDDFFVGVTDASGDFFLPSNPPSGTLIAIGGVNIDTGMQNTLVLKAPEGSKTINPLTTLVEAVVASGDAISVADAMVSVTAAFDLQLPAGTDLKSFDPISFADSSLDAQKVAVQIATLLTLSQGGSATGQTALENLASEVLQGASTGQTVDLANADTVSSILGATSVDLAKVVSATTEIAGAVTLADVSLIQAKALDNIAPDAPQSLSLLAAFDTGISSSDGVTKMTSPVVRIGFVTLSLDGKAVVAGDRVVVNANDSERVSLTLTAEDIGRGWVDVDLGQFQDGAWQVAARLIDQAENSSAFSAVLALTVDTKPPESPFVGPIAGDNVINAAEQGSVLAGFAEAGAKVTLALGNQDRAVVADAVSGAWLYSLQASDIAALGQGSKTLMVTATDAAGNISTTVNSVVTVDTIVPVQPVIAVVASDNVINAAEQSAIISGMAEAGANVVLSLAGAARSIAANVQTGAWSYALQQADVAALGQGSATISAIATDASGNSSAAANLSVVVDTIVPSVPALGAVAVDNIINAAEQSAILTGMAEAGALITLTLGSANRTVTANAANGTWSYTLAPADLAALGEGAVSIAVTQTDSAGNNSGAASRAVVIDTQLSGAVGTIVRVDDNVSLITGAIAAGDTTNDNTLGMVGTLSAGLAADETLAVYDGSTRLGVASVTSTNWIYTTPGLNNGAHNLYIRIEDAVGNQGAPSAAFAVTVSADVPSSTIQITSIIDDATPGTGVVQNGGGTNDKSPLLAGTISGVLISGDVVQIYDRLGLLGSADVSGSSWSFATAPLAEGSHSFTAVVEAAGGNQGASSAEYRIILDTLAPAAPVLANIAGDNVINAQEIVSTVTGTAEAGVSVALSFGSMTRTIAADMVTGFWTYSIQASDLAALGQGARTISAIATDVMGNASLAGSRTVTVDTVAPNAPVIADIASNNLINAAEQSSVITGSAEAGATIALALAGAVRIVTADLVTGAWSYTLQPSDIVAMGEGSKTISAIATDAAGNAGSAVSRQVIVDTVSPGAPSLSTIAGDNRINASEINAVLTGSAEPGSTVTLTLGGAGRTVMASAATGTWSYTLQASDIAALGQGATIIAAAAADSAGNVSTVASATVVVDTLSPIAPTIATIAGNNVINAAEQTTTITGTAEGGAIVVLSIEGQVRTAVADPVTGAWTYTLQPTDIAAVGQGTKTLSVVSRDAAGNQSLQTSQNIIVDTRAPSIPLIGTIAGDNVINVSEAAALDASGTTSTILSGTAEAGSTITLTIGALSPSVVANGAGGWAYTLNASEIAAWGEGKQTLKATATDAAGNSSVVALRSLTIETVASLAPFVWLFDDTGAAVADKLTNNGWLVVGGLASGTTWQYSIDGSAWASGSGTSLAVTGDGTRYISVRQISAAGNTSLASAPFAFTLDTVAPAAPAMALVNDSGASTSDRITSAGAITVSGVEAGASWQYSIGDGATWRDGVGNSFTVTGDGMKNVVVRQTDLAGNTGVASQPFQFTLDTTVPLGTVTSFAGDTGIAGLLTPAELNTGVALQLTNMEPGTTATVKIIREIGVDGGSAWGATYTVSAAQPTLALDAAFGSIGFGYYRVEVYPQDIAGNISLSAPSILVAEAIGASGAFTLVNGAYVGTTGGDVGAGDPSQDEILIGGEGNDRFYTLTAGDIFVGGGGQDSAHVSRATVEVADRAGGGTHYEIGVYADPGLLGPDVGSAFRSADGPLWQLGGNQAFVQAETIAIRGADGALVHIFGIVEDGSGQRLLALDGADNRLTLGIADDRVDGGDGDDLIAGLTGNDWISGGAGDDILSAGLPLQFSPFVLNDSSYLIGGNGNDALVAFSGFVDAQGGDGQDIFALGGATAGIHLTVEDFVAGQDRIDVGQFLATYGEVPADTESWLNSHAAGDGFGNVVITLNANSSIEILNAQLANLTSLDFVWTVSSQWQSAAIIL